jgi:hypothetical protein
MNLTDIYRVFHPGEAQYIFFSEAHEILSKTEHILGQKAILNKYLKTEMTPFILSDNRIKLELKNIKKKKYRKTHGY